MLWSTAADALLVLHALFIAWVVLGGLAAWWWPRAAWGHLPALAWGAWVEFSGWPCPLTGWEAWLRESAGQSVPAGSFIEHHVGGLVYPQGLTRDAQQLLGFSLLGFNLAVYAVAAWRRARRRRIA